MLQVGLHKDQNQSKPRQNNPTENVMRCNNDTYTHATLVGQERSPPALLPCMEAFIAALMRTEAEEADADRITPLWLSSRCHGLDENEAAFNHRKLHRNAVA